MFYVFSYFARFFKISQIQAQSLSAIGKIAVSLTRTPLLTARNMPVDYAEKPKLASEPR